MAALTVGAPAVRVRAQETVTALQAVHMSTTTGEKPQSKVWFHDARWWAVLASSSTKPKGTWLWRLESNNHWTNVLQLSSSTSAKADTLALGDLAHVLLHASTSQLVSLEYVPAQRTYRRWTVRPTATSIPLSGSETATIDVDSTDRLWLSAESGSHILVYYSDFPYTTFRGPISLAEQVDGDDISVVTALPFHDPPQIGVLWSDQTTERFGFRVHVDGTDPLVWYPDEVPASQSALHVGNGMGDDHLNVKTGSDGTLYAAVKTSYDTNDFPHVALLVRRPDGHWDDLHFVDDDGTRGIVLLNEPADLIRVVYEISGTIYYRDSLASAIGFGARRTLFSGGVNDPTSTKMNWTNQVVVLGYGKGVLIRRSGVPTTTTPTTSTTQTMSSTTATLSTTTSPPTTSTTTSTLPSGPTLAEIRVGASSDDAEEAASGSVTLTSSDLELTTDGTKLQTVGIRFPGLGIPHGAAILEAWVQFQVDQTTSEPTAVRIHGQAADDATPFEAVPDNVSSRARTAAFTDWSIPAWSSIGAHGAEQRTPDLGTLVQEIVDRPGWSSGRALAVIVTGSGSRVAEAWDGVAGAAPLLHVEYVVP